MTDNLINAIAAITVAFLGILVPLLTVIMRRSDQIAKSNKTQQELLKELCEKLDLKPAIPEQDIRIADHMTFRRSQHEEL